MRHSFAPVRNVNVGLRAILRGDWEEEWPRTTQVVDYGIYYEQLSRYLQYFDRDRFSLTTYRAIKEAPQTVVRSICRFLGIPEDVDFSDVLGGKANKGVYSKLRLRLIQLTNPFRFEYFYDGQRLRPRENVGPFGRAVIRCARAVDRHLLQPVVANERPSLDPEIKAELAAHYRPDAKKLREEFDLDIEHWSVFAT
jgi:hypothetical protein